MRNVVRSLALQNSRANQRLQSAFNQVACMLNLAWLVLPLLWVQKWRRAVQDLLMDMKLAGADWGRTG